MTIGTLGDVVFSVSSKKVQTFNSMSWKKSYKYATHNMFGRKGLVEYTGMDPDEIELDMEFSVFTGVNPMKMLKALEKMAQKHKIAKLIIGHEVIGNSWVITGIQIESQTFFADGTMMAASVKVNIKEYLEE